MRGLGALQVGSQAHLSIIVPADGMIAAVGAVTSACPHGQLCEKGYSTFTVKEMISPGIRWQARA